MQRSPEGVVYGRIQRTRNRSEPEHHSSNFLLQRLSAFGNYYTPINRPFLATSIHENPRGALTTDSICTITRGQRSSRLIGR